MTEKLRVGVVGMGIGQLHLLSWIGVEGAEVVAIGEVDPARRDQAASDWNVTGVSSIAEMIEFGVDVIDVCTPPQLHQDHILECFDAGIHVICEKPLVDSLASIDTLVNAEHEASSRLMPIFQYRYGQGAQQAKALIDAGIAGRLHLGTSETMWRRERSYYDEVPWRGTWAGERGGSVLSHAIHNHDLLTWIGGSVSSISGVTTTRVNDIETEDCAAAVATTIDGAPLTMAVTLGAATEMSRLRWCFDAVTIESTHEPYDPAKGPWTFDFVDAKAEESAHEVWAQLPEQGAQYTGQFANFVDALETDTDFGVTLADARRSLELVTAWYHSSRTGDTQTLPLVESHPLYDSWVPAEYDR